MRQWARIAWESFVNNLYIGRKTNLLWQKEESWESENSRVLKKTSLIHLTFSDIRKTSGSSVVKESLDRMEKETGKFSSEGPTLSSNSEFLIWVILQRWEQCFQRAAWKHSWERELEALRVPFFDSLAGLLVSDTLERPTNLGWQGRGGSSG